MKHTVIISPLMCIVLVVGDFWASDVFKMCVRFQTGRPRHLVIPGTQ